MRIRACIFILSGIGRFGEFCAEEYHDLTQILKHSGCCVDNNSLFLRTAAC